MYCCLQDRDGVAFTGQRSLLEYEVTHFNMTPVIDSHKTGQRVDPALYFFFDIQPQTFSGYSRDQKFFMWNLFLLNSGIR